jgi:FtsP/CotA-like multicopper oxidase with cupredoxin domain
MRSRRDFLKLGLAGGAMALSLPGSTLAQLCPPDTDIPPAASPSVQPFAMPLPIPPPLKPINPKRLHPAPNPSAHQRYDEFPPKKFYEIHVQAAQHVFHPEYPTSTIFGYDGMTPGPTIFANNNEPILVRIWNDLPADFVGWGIPSITTHLHNAHTASESDGFPGDFYESGQFHDHHFPNYPAGGDPREIMNFLWYHDHRQDYTAQNVVRGLAGNYIVFDDQDTGDEKDRGPGAFRLPSGEFDVPLVFKDRNFDADGKMFFDVFNTDGILGDRWTVNGAIQPYFKVRRRKYRLRMLNAGPSRFYTFYLSSGQPFIYVSNDGNLMPRPVISQSVTLSVAERADVIVDFSDAKVGDQIYLLNRLEQLSGRGPTGRILTPGDQLMRFDVESNDTHDPSEIPDVMRPLPDISLDEVVRDRLWTFDYLEGTWLINDKTFDATRSDAQVKQGTAEIWTLRNEGIGWSHPIHIHLEEFQILSRNGRRPSKSDVEHARKDVVRLGPSEEIKVFMRFRDFLGKYVIHCHNVVHEDHSMMLRWDVVP